MALSPILSISISNDSLVSTITDETVYGSPNADRADLRVFVQAYKVDVDNVATEVAVDPDDGDPQTDSEWTYDTPNDGHFKVYYVAIPAYDSGTDYNQYDAVYDPADDTVYRSKSGSNQGNAVSDTDFWEVISEPATLANNEGTATESANIDSLVYRRVLTWLSQHAYGELISENCACSDCDDNELIPPYNLFSLLLNGAQIADQRTEVVKGEQICRRIESRYINC